MQCCWEYKIKVVQLITYYSFKSNLITFFKLLCFMAQCFGTSLNGEQVLSEDKESQKERNNVLVSGWLVMVSDLLHTLQTNDSDLLIYLLD